MRASLCFSEQHDEKILRNIRSRTKTGQLARTLLGAANSSPECLCSQGSPGSVLCLWGGCLPNARNIRVERKEQSLGSGLSGRTCS